VIVLKKQKRWNVASWISRQVKFGRRLREWRRQPREPAKFISAPVPVNCEVTRVTDTILVLGATKGSLFH